MTRPQPDTQQVLHMALGYVVVLKDYAIKWTARFLNTHFPSGNRLGYIFKPATADAVTLVLLVLLLVPMFQGLVFRCLFLLALMCHVGITWLAHMHNLTKLGTMDKIGSSLVAQQRMLTKRHTALQQGVEAVAQLQVKIALLETNTKNAQELEERHAKLEALATRAETLQQLVESKERTLSKVPKLQTRLAHLQARRRLVEKLKWAIQVLTVETSKAPTLESEYTRLREARGLLQTRKQEAQAEAQQVAALEDEVRQLERQASLVPHLRAKVEAFKRDVGPLTALDSNTSHKHMRASGSYVADVTKSVDCEGGDQARMYNSMGTKAVTALSQDWARAAAHQEQCGDASAPRPPAAARRAISNLSSTASVGSSHGSLAGRRRMVLETPSGGSRVFQVMDNEAFYTPLMPSDMTPVSGMAASVAFTPGPEAAAIAAALSAGMPVPTRSQGSTMSQGPVWPHSLLNGHTGDLADPGTVQSKAVRPQHSGGSSKVTGVTSAVTGGADSRREDDQGTPLSGGNVAPGVKESVGAPEPAVSQAESLSLM